MLRTLLPLFAAFLLTAADRSRPVTAPILTTPDAADNQSYARPAEARVTHIALDLSVDFARKRLTGTATLDILAAPGADRIVLDDHGLTIDAITGPDGRALPYEIGADDPIRGAPLTIRLGDARRVTIRYASAPDAGALQWLTPEQTAGKRHPFLFSQSEAILARGWIPTQDSPGIRQTWDATIRVPKGLRALMSAGMLTPDGETVPGEPDLRAYRFRMGHPVPPYLIAIAVGDIAFQSMGPRTGVYAEPATLPTAAHEFVDLERMMHAAERLYGPYRWGRYDLLILPPSFPYGGMENPRLTFATPTVIAGDRSLVSLVAHELAHSWSGNLVTNASWDDFWLNEGFTTYAENRIMEVIYGKPRADELAELGWADMETAIAEAGGMQSKDSQLRLDIGARDPDEVTSNVAYEKGAVFLRTIEQAVGRERFDAWLRDYFARHPFQPQTSSGFLSDVRAHLIRGDAALESRLQLDRWVYQPGVPENAVHVRAAGFAPVDAAVRAVAGGGPAPAAWADWNSQERQRFLDMLPRQMASARLASLDRALGLSGAGNAEIRFAWLKLAIVNRYEAALPSLEQFLAAQGRRKFVVPLFRALMQQHGWGEPIARRIYAKTRSLYHPVTVSGVDAELHG